MASWCELYFPRLFTLVLHLCRVRLCFSHDAGCSFLTLPQPTPGHFLGCRYCQAAEGRIHTIWAPH
jgi:hypothetical protein